MATSLLPPIATLLAGGDERRSAPGWLGARRAQALERANALTVPSTRDEEWRFTDLAPLARKSFKPAVAAADPDAQAVAAWFVPEAVARLVFIDGHYAPQWSTPAAGGLAVQTLQEALHAHAAALEGRLAALANVETRAFTALNTAHLRDGASVRVAGNVTGGVVHVLFLASQADTATLPRVLVEVAPGAEVTVIEDHVAVGDAAVLSNAVTEIDVAPTARVRHVRLQRLNAASYSIGHTAVRVAKDASYLSQTVTLGARLSRYDLDVVQQGEGAHATLDGLALIDGRQHADTHTTLDHAAPHGTSQQLHKTIVGGGAHAVFNGKILVRPGAQLIDSAQESRNLLLSDKARVDTKPQLEIYADDVKCAHGATVGQLEPDQLFYLRSRGLPDKLARSLLTYAFGAQVIERIPVPSLVRELERRVLEQTGL